MEEVVIHLSPFDLVRLVASDVNNADFVGMLTPLIRRKVQDGQLFRISGDAKSRSFRYIIKDGSEYISNLSGGGMIPLDRGRSFTGVIMDKFTNNEFTRMYQRVKENYSNLLKAGE